MHSAPAHGQVIMAAKRGLESVMDSVERHDMDLNPNVVESTLAPIEEGAFWNTFDGYFPVGLVYYVHNCIIIELPQRSCPRVHCLMRLQRRMAGRRKR
jgi:hypothetical protein